MAGTTTEKCNIKHPRQPSESHSTCIQRWPFNITQTVLSELRAQRGLIVPLIAMNLTWFLRITITTSFLGRLGQLQLAGGALGFTFANVTGLSVLNGICGAMEPICGQAYGAKNFKLLHKTLLMTTLLLLLASLLISFMWLHVDKILYHFGQQEEISAVAKTTLFYLIPDLLIFSFLCPIKTYLNAQSMTIPVMFSSGLGLALHIPINILLSKARGLEGVAMAVWISDLIVVVPLACYIWIMENRKDGRWNDGGWLEQKFSDWVKLVRLVGPCCLTTCLEWWCYEILVLLSGRLANAKRDVGVLAIVLNFDYLLYSVMISLATSVSTRVSNELGANQPGAAYQAAYASLAVSILTGCIGGLIMVAARGLWGPLFSNDKETTRYVKKMFLLMAVVEVVNFPLVLCGGIVRGTAKPWLAMYASVGGFYLLALPLAVLLAFKAGLQLGGLLIGFLAGVIVSLLVLVVFVVRIDWVDEAMNAQKLSSDVQEVDKNAGIRSNLDTSEEAEARQGSEHHEGSTINLNYLLFPADFK